MKKKKKKKRKGLLGSGKAQTASSLPQLSREKKHSPSTVSRRTQNASAQKNRKFSPCSFHFDCLTPPRSLPTFVPFRVSRVQRIDTPLGQAPMRGERKRGKSLRIIVEDSVQGRIRFPYFVPLLPLAFVAQSALGGA